MFQQSYSVGGENEIHLQFEHGGGDLHLIGTNETYLRIQGEGAKDEYQSDWKNGTLTMDLHEDAVFYIPRKINVRVSGAFGNLSASELAGNLGVEGGHTVLVEENPAAPVVAFQVWVGVGSADERGATKGLPAQEEGGSEGQAGDKGEREGEEREGQGGVEEWEGAAEGGGGGGPTDSGTQSVAN